MATLAPPLECAIELTSGLQNGQGVRESLIGFIRRQPEETFAKDLEELLWRFDRGVGAGPVVERQPNLFRRTLIDIAFAGLNGQSILGQLVEIQLELRRAAELEIQKQIESLPLKMLFPLLLVQFPAFLILLFGPLLNQLLREISR